MTYRAQMQPCLVSPGRDCATLDFFKRSCDAADVEVILPVGEGAFHQRSIAINLAS
jgi:hypothetical protein